MLDPKFMGGPTKQPFEGTPQHKTFSDGNIYYIIFLVVNITHLFPVFRLITIGIALQK